nr:hypothetical protein [uncultured Gellertiella sp.]
MADKALLAVSATAPSNFSQVFIGISSVAIGALKHDQVFCCIARKIDPVRQQRTSLLSYHSLQTTTISFSSRMHQRGKFRPLRPGGGRMPSPFSAPIPLHIKNETILLTVRIATLVLPRRKAGIS